LVGESEVFTGTLSRVAVSRTWLGCPLRGGHDSRKSLDVMTAQRETSVCRGQSADDGRGHRLHKYVSCSLSLTVKWKGSGRSRLDVKTCIFLKGLKKIVTILCQFGDLLVAIADCRLRCPTERSSGALRGVRSGDHEGCVFLLQRTRSANSRTTWPCTPR
jgi:hypothetical protein